MCPAFDAGACPLAQMGSANDIQTIGRLVIATGINGLSSLVGSTDSHLLLALEPSASARGSGGDRLTPIRFATRHHGPDDPGHLVGQSDRGELARLALQQL